MDDFLFLMQECYGFLTHRWEIWGFSFSFFNVAMLLWAFDTVMNTVASFFGEQWTWGDYYDM